MAHYSMLDLKQYLKERDNYINLFEILNANDVPQDIRNYILDFNKKLNVPLYHQFDKGIKEILKDINNKYILTVDAYHLLNYMIRIFIEGVTKNAENVVAYTSTKVLKPDDIKYALGIYTKHPTKLINEMIERGHYNVGMYTEANKEGTKVKTAANTYIKTSIIENILREFILKDVYNRKGKTITNFHYKLNVHTDIFLAAVVDVLIQEILLSAIKIVKKQKKEMINADDIIEGMKHNNYLKVIFLELFI